MVQCLPWSLLQLSHWSILTTSWQVKSAGVQSAPNTFTGLEQTVSRPRGPGPSPPGPGSSRQGLELRAHRFRSMNFFLSSPSPQVLRSCYHPLNKLGTTLRGSAYLPRSAPIHPSVNCLVFGSFPMWAMGIVHRSTVPTHPKGVWLERCAILKCEPAQRRETTCGRVTVHPARHSMLIALAGWLGFLSPPTVRQGDQIGIAVHASAAKYILSFPMSFHSKYGVIRSSD
jgi:hypothetical protein